MSIKKKVAFVCSECNSRNYTKNKSAEKRLEMKKYCQTCDKHTLHKEDK